MLVRTVDPCQCQDGGLPFLWDKAGKGIKISTSPKQIPPSLSKLRHPCNWLNNKLISSLSTHSNDCRPSSHHWGEMCVGVCLLLDKTAYKNHERLGLIWEVAWELLWDIAWNPTHQTAIFFLNLFIWLNQVLVAVREIFVVACGISSCGGLSSAVCRFTCPVAWGGS